jgi:uncharacterized protein (TIGR03435 family)
MQVNRSLEKMRSFFLKRGVTLSIAAISVAIAENSVQAAPPTLASSVIPVALSKGALAGGYSITSIKGALKIMAWSKAKITAVTTAALLITASTATVATTAVRHYRDDAMWNNIALLMKNKDDRPMSQLPRALSLRKSKLERRFNYDFAQWDANKKIIGLAVPVAGVWGHAYNISRTRIVNQNLLPSGKYDFISSDSPHPSKALQSALSKQFGLVAAKEMVETNVLVLSVARAGAPGLKPSTEGGWNFSVTPGQWTFSHVGMSGLALEVEHCLNVPVIDQTGLADLYDVNLIWGEGGWTPDPDKLKQALLDQLGLQLTQDTQSVEMLVLKKAR